MYLLVAFAAENSNGPTAMTQGELIAWIAGIATAVATVVTAAMTLWFRMMDKPAPEFEIVPLYQRWDNSHGPVQLPELHMTISNVGSGSARLVSFISSYSSLYLKKNDKNLPQEHDPILEVGQSVEITAHTIPSRWDEASLIITWKEDSHLFWWRYSKYKVFKLAELFEKPVMMDYNTDRTTGSYEGVPVPANSTLHKQIQELVTQLEASGIVELDNSNWFASRKLLRKLSKAGWRWRQYLSTSTPGATGE